MTDALADDEGTDRGIADDDEDTTKRIADDDEGTTKRIADDDEGTTKRIADDDEGAAETHRPVPGSPGGMPLNVTEAESMLLQTFAGAMMTRAPCRGRPTTAASRSDPPIVGGAPAETRRTETRWDFTATE